jgi:hypothetical protein
MNRLIVDGKILRDEKRSRFAAKQQQRQDAQRNATNESTEDLMASPTSIGLETHTITEEDVQNLHADGNDHHASATKLSLLRPYMNLRDGIPTLSYL